MSAIGVRAPGRLCTSALVAPASLAAMKARATSRANCIWHAPPYGIVYGLPAAAASIAIVGAEVRPWSRPTPYTVCGRRPTLEMPFSARYTRAVCSFARLKAPYSVLGGPATPPSVSRAATEEAYAIGASSNRFAASNTLTVPSTFTRAPSGGSARTNGTWSAARWITFVIECSSSACSREAPSVMSPATCGTASTSSPSSSRSRRGSVERSKVTTSRPSRTSSCTTHAPMQPYAPVTRIRSLTARMISREPELHSGSVRDHRRRLARVEQRGRDDQLRAREVVELGRHRADRPAERVAGGVPADRAIRVERQERRHPEQLEVVERLEVGPVDDRRALRLDPDPDGRARETGALVGDEGDVARPPHADEPRLDATLAQSCRNAGDHLRMAEAVDRRLEAVAERGADGDDDLLGRGAPSRLAELVEERARPVGRPHSDRTRVELVRQGPELLPARAFEPVAGAGPEVVVALVHGRLDGAVGSDDRGRLQVVGGDPLTLHAEHRVGDVGEARLVERPCDVEAGDPLGEHAVARGNVGGAVAVRQRARVVAVRGGVDLGLGHLREAERGEDGPDGAGGALADARQLVLRDRLDARVDLPIALDRQPFVEIVGVVVAAAEGVVAPGHHGVAGRDEVRAGEELAHQLRRLADLGVRRDRVVPGGHLEVEPGGKDVLGEDLARPARHTERERDARDRAVLHTLRAGGADRREAARLEVEHRFS